MPKFIVEIPEVHYSIRKVEAESAEEALELAYDVDEIHLEYSHTLEEGVLVRQELVEEPEICPSPT